MALQTSHGDFVEVLDEPCHKPFIRNSRVNIFIAKLARNMITMYHRHKQNTIYVVIAGSYCRTQVLGSDARAQEYVTGDCFSGEYQTTPLTHRVECLTESPSDAWFVGIEILIDKAFISDIIFEHTTSYTPISKVTIPGCHAYRLKLAPQETSSKHLIHYSGVFISLTNGQLNINSEEHFPFLNGTIERGFVTWFNGPIQFEMQNIASEPYEAILIFVA